VAEQRKFLGYGKSYQYTARPGWVLEECGNATYEVDPAILGNVCDGCGCRCCGFTGDESKRQERNKAGKNGPKKKRK